MLRSIPSTTRSSISEQSDRALLQATPRLTRMPVRTRSESRPDPAALRIRRSRLLRPVFSTSRLKLGPSAPLRQDPTVPNGIAHPAIANRHHPRKSTFERQRRLVLELTTIT